MVFSNRTVLILNGLFDTITKPLMRRLLLFFILLSTSVHAQTSAARWYKGNTHLHTYRSDGSEFPELVMDWYKSHGYNFVCLSDHDILPYNEIWKPVFANPPWLMVSQALFDNYLEKYGKDWVTFTRDSAGTKVRVKPLNEFRGLFEESGKFLIIPAEEITAKYKGKAVHLCATNLTEVLPPLSGTSTADVLQKNLDQFYALRARSGQPMLVQINHPNYLNSLSLQDMEGLTGARFFEVMNGHFLVKNYGDSLSISTEELWDKLDIRYLHDGKPLLFGIGSEDSHDYHDFGPAKANPGRAWIMVKAKSLNAPALVEAMERGDFYATTGVTLKDVRFAAAELKVEVAAETGIDYTVEFWGAKKGDERGRLLKKVKGPQAAYKLAKDVLFVRAKIISSKQKENPFKEGDAETAWTQPVTPASQSYNEK